MGLRLVNGVITDQYGRTFETYIDDKGIEDIRPIGVCRDILAFNEDKIEK